jgi:hypothetical protein
MEAAVQKRHEEAAFRVVKRARDMFVADHDELLPRHAARYMAEPSTRERERQRDRGRERQ